MIFLAAILIALLVALARGGSFMRLADLPFRFAPLILLGLLIQILIFSPILGPHLNHVQSALAYNASMILIWGTLLLNWRLPGVPLMGIGVFLNWLAITFNGGFMPATPEALQQAGLWSEAMAAGERHNNSILVTPETQLPFLTDVMAVPEALPLSNVFSVGDLLLAFGTAWLIQRTMVGPTSRAERVSA